MKYETIQVRFEDATCILTLSRPKNDNTINDQLVTELHHALSLCDDTIRIVVVEGQRDVFCTGADFQAMQANSSDPSGFSPAPHDPAPLYELWYRLATGPFVTVAHVEGRATAGGIGFVAACDLALASTRSSFGLSELLFGIFPASVMPFLVRKIGMQKAHYLALTTKPIDVHRATDWGLIDVCADDSQKVLNWHLQRLRCLPKRAIEHYKSYVKNLTGDVLARSKSTALQANRAMFSDGENLSRIYRYVQSGEMPWEH